MSYAIGDYEVMCKLIRDYIVAVVGTDIFGIVAEAMSILIVVGDSQDIAFATQAVPMEIDI